MQIPIPTYLSVVNLFISLVIAFVLINKKGFSLKTLSFSTCIFFMAVWVLSEAFYHFNEPESLSRLIIQIGYSSTAIMSTALIIFMVSFWKEDKGLFAAVILIGAAISLIPFVLFEGHTLERVGDAYISFAGPVFLWIGLPYAALAYMGTSIFLLWTSRKIGGNARRRIRIISIAFLFQYPISAASYIYGQLASDPLISPVVQSLTLPITLTAILYALIS